MLRLSISLPPYAMVGSSAGAQIRQGDCIASSLRTSRCMQRNDGFTLIELMLVVAVIAILASIGGGYYVSYIRSTEAAEAKTTLGHIGKSIENYVERKLTIAPATLQASLIGSYLAVDGNAPADTLSNIIPELLLRPTAEWTYKVENVVIEENTRSVSYCLSARLNDAYTEGYVLMSSPAVGDADWDENFYIASYVNKDDNAVNIEDTLPCDGMATAYE